MDNEVNTIRNFFSYQVSDTLHACADTLQRCPHNLSCLTPGTNNSGYSYT